MKMLFWFNLLLAAGSLLVAETAEAKLTVGDPAPKLQTGKWVQGDPVTAFDSKHVYIVEFWATWCGPCRASIPHLNELYQKFKDRGLIAIGQDVWEQNDSGVEPFVKKMGDKMTYRVALDDKSQEKDGWMAVNWMKAAEQNGIPTAFIVDQQGRIAWIGHPMMLDEKLLEKIMAGKFDTAAYAAEYDKEQQEQKQRSDQYQKLRQAMQDKDWNAAEATLTEIEKTAPAPMRLQFTPIRMQILFGRGDTNGAYRLAESTGDANPDNIGLQNELAWMLVVNPGTGAHGLALAEKFADRANTTSGGKEPAILDTLARAQFRNGKQKEAVATQQKAVDAATDDTQKAALQKTLADYQAGKLPDAR